MGVGAVTGKASPQRLGSIPQITLTVEPARVAPRPRGDAFVHTPSPKPEGPRSEVGKLAEKAWVGTLGVGAGGLGYFMSRTMMSFLKDLGPLTLKNLVKGQMVGGVVAGLPFALIGDSFGYKNGEVSAKRYWGNVVSGALSFGLWGVGAMAVGALLPVGGFLGVAAGLAAGGLVSSLFDKTVGREISNGIAEALPEKGAKSAADFVVKWITNPIDKAIVQPVKRNWKLFLGTGGVAAVYFGVKGGQGKEALKGLGAMGVSMVPQMFGDVALAEKFPMKPMAGVDLQAPEGKMFSPEDGKIVDVPMEEVEQPE
ncbi:MAG: hypothetical protein FJZ01_21955 [Candidatus Sericytochromatia bacterium]|nr:hypothetical protein [Candidatus Tanganyikabacteria bacterium]